MSNDQDIRKWGCSYCGRTEQASPNLNEDERRRIRNCERITNPALFRPWSPTEPIRCPWSWPDEVWQAVTWWDDHSKGVRWQSSDIMDEPAYVSEAVSLIATEVAKQRG